MEPNIQQPHNEQSMPQMSQPIVTPQPKKSATTMIIASVALFLVLGGAVATYFFWYAPYKETKKQEALAEEQLRKYQAVASRIESGDIALLTKEDYLLYLNQPIDYSNWVPKKYTTTTQVGAFTLALDKEWGAGDIFVFGPEILFGDAYIYLDEVVTKDGPEDLSTNSFEDKSKDMFHRIDEYERVETSLGDYYMGERGLHTESDADDILKISGRIILPFLENVETVTLTKADSEKLTTSGKLEDISFDGDAFSVDYPRGIELITIKAYNEGGQELQRAIRGSSSTTVYVEYNEPPQRVELLLGRASEDIEIPFVLGGGEVSEVPVNTETQTSTVIPENTTGLKEGEIVTVTDQAEIQRLQRVIGEFTAIFRAENVQAAHQYFVTTGYFGEEIPEVNDSEFKKGVAQLGDSLFDFSQQDLEKMSGVEYERAYSKEEGVMWAVTGITSKDPDGDPFDLWVYLKEINGNLYVVDFE